MTSQELALLDEVEKGAFRFFWEQADPKTGLVKDRAHNHGTDDYTVASTASTGYGLAALAVGAERGWVTRAEAEERAKTTLRFLLGMPHVHGWLYHFVDMRTGERTWQCEISTIDTGLLAIGALACGRYFHGEVEQLADRLYDRMDWTWVCTNGGEKPDKRVVTHGWKPEGGFLANDWNDFCELPLLYLLGLGAKTAPLPADFWDAWKRGRYTYGGIEAITGGPIFMHQMPLHYYRLQDMRDRAGYDYWVNAQHATQINRQFCIDHADRRKTYGPQVWGLNASDGPKGYMAYGVPEPEDGTVSPTGVLASLPFTPDLSLEAARTIRTRFGDRVWGRYGFVNAFNVDADWFDPDVIGIDLGMALLAIENHRTGLVWRLVASHPATARALAAAGLHRTREPAPRALQISRSSAVDIHHQGTKSTK